MKPLTLDDPMPFGRYKGKTVQEVIDISPFYLIELNPENPPEQRFIFTAETQTLIEQEVRDRFALQDRWELENDSQ